jgi:pPIWI_RE module N-terminal domain/RNaseH domain of pPIWI_RE/MID domain of pPIWI_RE
MHLTESMAFSGSLTHPKEKAKMAKSAPGPGISLARMNIVPEAFMQMTASRLRFGYEQEINTFSQKISTPQERRTAPVRQLNNLLLACLPTLTHGFEYRNGGHYLLAVGTTTHPLDAPDPQHVHELVVAWARHWARQYYDEHQAACQQFLEEIQHVPLRAWERVAPESLVQDTETAGGLVYAAIPALLATLLHKQEISLNGQQQTLKLRKVQGDGSDRTGLYLVSQPFRGWYQHETKGVLEEREGYFAYRIDFEVETQAGRFYSDGVRLKPWVFLRVSCQRYAHQGLSAGNFGRDFSVLTSFGRPRWAGVTSDDTLVRLQVGRRGDEYTWLQYLPTLLEEARARPLANAEELLKRQTGQCGVTGPSVDPLGDEYYVVHAEGYKYERRGHAIKTGFHFDERREVLTHLLEKLTGVLVPDGTIPADQPMPTGVAVPAAMRGFDFMSAKVANERRQAVRLAAGEARPPKVAKPSTAIVLHQRLQREAFRLKAGQKVQLLLVYREKSTCALMKQQVRKALLLSDTAPFPEWLVVQEVLITEAELLAHYDKAEDKRERHASYRRQYEKKREAWLSLLAANKSKKAQAVLAFIELARRPPEPPRNIKGAVREACARLQITSQMVETVNYKTGSQTDFSQPVLSRTQNAALDLLVRHTGVLYGPPSEAYVKAGLPKAVADQLDVVALYRRQHLDAGLHFALAVRLRANGEVDVRLPHGKENKWIPYVAAGPILGSFFADKRRDRGSSSSGTIGLSLSPTQLANFAAQVVTEEKDRPTLIVVEAEGWRNEGKNPIWGQLKNNHLAARRDTLDFAHINGQGHYKRTDEAVQQLVGIMRLRMNGETPQYLPAVMGKESAQDFKPLSGFIDRSTEELWHYFSVGRAPKTLKAENKNHERGLYKLDVRSAETGDSSYGANTSFRHQQVVELVPFFVKPELQTPEGLLALCRVPHYLRASPAWSTGNTLRPFPLHLAKCLVDDYLCLVEH